MDQFLPEGRSDYWGYRYRSDSRLLVLIGGINEDEGRQGAHYFVLENDRLKEVHHTLVVKECDQ